MNIERLQQLKLAILREPHHYEQNTWGSPFHCEAMDSPPSFVEEREKMEIDAGDDTVERTPLCGTACCLAGMAFAISDGVGFQRWMREFTGIVGLGTKLSIPELAADWLDLDENQRDVLFACSDSWPEPFTTNYRKAKTLQERAEIGASMIDWLIEYADYVSKYGMYYKAYPASVLAKPPHKEVSHDPMEDVLVRGSSSSVWPVPVAEPPPV